MYVLNKIAGYIASPVTLAWLGVFLSLVCCYLKCKRAAWWILFVCIVWAWCWATPLMRRIVGYTLERKFLVCGRVRMLEDYPFVDAIVLHGGSMSIATNINARGEMCGSADRVWMAVRLWKAEKGPNIYVMGRGAPVATLGLIEDFGVPTNALICVDTPRNTEEEARFVAKAMKHVAKPKVLVVTSAWHMMRTMLMYRKFASDVEPIPAPCDFENTLAGGDCFSLWELLPNAQFLAANEIALHEWIGIIGYRLFR